MNISKRVLLVDDEKYILEFLSYNLTKEGFEVMTCNDSMSVLNLIEEFRPSLILIDIMMPNRDGIETCEAIRSNPKYDHIIIAFLTARAEDYSQIAGLEAGADDYIKKPIKPKVLVSRVKALLRRKSGENSYHKSSNELIEISDLRIDRETYSVNVQNQNIFLPRKEFELLYLLASKPGKVFKREEIFTKIWGDDVLVGGRTIDVHVRKIRQKLTKQYITTVKGVGYKFNTNI